MVGCTFSSKYYIEFLVVLDTYIFLSIFYYFLTLFISFLAGFPVASPALIYGRAALLGLSGGERSCIQTYAKCPKNDVSYYICIFIYIRVMKINFSKSKMQLTSFY